MRPESLALDLKIQKQISQSVLQRLHSKSPNVADNHNEATYDDYLGGVICRGQLAWIAVGSNIQIFSLKNGECVAGYSFNDSQRTSHTAITYVCEMTITTVNSCLLLISVQRPPIGGRLYIFSVAGSRVIHRIDFADTITSCCFIDEAVCKRGCLAAFNGCAVVGSDAGDIYIVDCKLDECKRNLSNFLPYNPSADESSCRIVPAPLDTQQIADLVDECNSSRINFGIKLDVSAIADTSAISSILAMTQMQMIAVGMENGLLVLYNLNDLSALHIACPPEEDSPLVKLTYLEPADDPRPCIYIWAFHENYESCSYAVMHAVTFNSKTHQDGENSYETFQWCRPDLTIPIHEKHSKPIACQSISKIVTEDEQFSLCLLGWTNKTSSFVLIFDLNQWYKEQMPRVCDWRDYPSYLAPFPIEIEERPLDIWLNSKTVAIFNSIQRPEEHFYPTSLNFDLVKFGVKTIFNLTWAGLQNNAIHKLKDAGATAILCPDECFKEFLEASLIPQLSEHNYHANPSLHRKREFLLSMALEYNCFNLLKDCAIQWADGSHMGAQESVQGLTLCTLTDWIWAQATAIKDRCNNLCVSLFDDSGITIDLRSRNILTRYSRQLKRLAELLNVILKDCRQYIPDEVYDTFFQQWNSIRMTYEYQEVLQWLLNVGILPEIVWNELSLPEAMNDTFTATPYPYRILNKYYTEQRQRFYNIDQQLLSTKTNGCKCLYIDMFLERECNTRGLRIEWNSNGESLYPPPSLQAMLRALLVPGIPLENKYILFMYLFLDLYMVLETEHFEVVQNLVKFPAVFNLRNSLARTTQAFWNFDHSEYELSLKDLFSPMTSSEPITSWQKELLINTLLIRDLPKLAVQALRAPGPPVDAKLQMRTLLANGLVIDAFELQHSMRDDGLLLAFFKGCHEQAKWPQVLALSMTEYEGKKLCNYLHSMKTLLAENLELIYLLQRDKYIEARSCYNEIKYRPRLTDQKLQFENTAGKIMSSYELSMNSTQRKFCTQYMTIKDRILMDLQTQSESSEPLSRELNPYIYDANSNVDGIFYRSILSAKRIGFSHLKSKEEQNDYIPLISRPCIAFDTCEFKKYTPAIEPKPYITQMKRRKEAVYDQNVDADMKQPDAKRKRFIQIGDDKRYPAVSAYLLSTGNNQNATATKSNENRNFDETIDMDDDQLSNNSELQDTVNLLSTPVVKSTRLDRGSRIESRCGTPQSILKRHIDVQSIASASPSVHSARRSVDFNERSLRFTATTPYRGDKNATLGAIKETGVIDEDDESDSMTSPYAVLGRCAIRGSITDSSSEMHTAEFDKSNETQNDQSTTSPRMFDNTATTESGEMSSPNKSFLNIHGRPGLRSQTPDSPRNVMSSTRLTRSQSKQQLNETGTSKYALNTSTPILAARSRSPAMARDRKSTSQTPQKPIESEMDVDDDSGDGIIKHIKHVDSLEQFNYVPTRFPSNLSSDLSFTNASPTKRALADSSIEEDIQPATDENVHVAGIAQAEYRTPVKGSLNIHGRPRLGRSKTPDSSANNTSSSRLTRSQSKSKLTESVKKTSHSTYTFTMTTSTTTRVSRGRSPIAEAHNSPALEKSATVDSEVDTEDECDAAPRFQMRRVLRDSSFFDSPSNRTLDSSYTSDDCGVKAPAQRRRMFTDSSIFESPTKQRTESEDEDAANAASNETERAAVDAAVDEIAESAVQDGVQVEEAVQAVQTEEAELVAQIEQIEQAEQAAQVEQTAQIQQFEAEENVINDVEQVIEPVVIEEEDAQIGVIESHVESEHNQAESAAEQEPESLTQDSSQLGDQTNISSTSGYIPRPGRILLDSPAMEPSMLGKFHQYDALNTSSFYNESAFVPPNTMRRMLDDSSIYIPAADASPAAPIDTDVCEVVQVDDDNDSESEPTNISDDSSNSNEAARLHYSSDDDDKDSQSEPTNISDDTSNSNDKDQKDDVIQILSSDDESSQNVYEIPESQDSYFIQNEGFVTSTQNYRPINEPNDDFQLHLDTNAMDEVQPMEMDSEQDFAEVIYSDLGTGEMVNFGVVGTEEVIDTEAPLVQATSSNDQGFYSQSVVYTQESDAQAANAKQVTVDEAKDLEAAAAESEKDVSMEVLVSAKTMHEPTTSDPSAANASEVLVTCDTLPDKIFSGPDDTNILDLGMVANEATVDASNIETTNLLDQAMILEQSEALIQTSTAVLDESKPVEEKALAKRSRSKSKTEDIEPEETPDVKEKPARRGRRKASQQKELPETVTEPIQAEKVAEKKPRKRTVSQQQDIVTDPIEINKTKPVDVSVSIRRRRGTSQQKETAIESTSSAMGIAESATEPAARKRRGASQQKEVTAESSAIQLAESVSEPTARKRRGASQQKEIVATVTIEATGTRQRRAASQQKEIPAPDEEPSTSKAVEKVRGRRPSKQTASEESDKPKAKSVKTKLSESLTLDASKTTGRRLRKATSHQSLHDADEMKLDDTLTFKATKPKRSMSYQSLSTIAELSSINVPDDESINRSMRAQSVTDVSLGSKGRKRKLSSSQQNLSTLDVDAAETSAMKKPAARPKRTASQASASSELGDRFDAEESVKSRSLRKAVSHQVLPGIDEESPEPTKTTRPTTRARRAESHQSLNTLTEDVDREIEPKPTKTRKAKVASQESLSESTAGTSRRRRMPSESSNASDTSRTTRKTKKADDSSLEMEISPSMSTRSRRTPSIDDDNSSTKSAKTKRSARAGSALSAISEDADSLSGRSTPNLNQSTRSQKSKDTATTEKRATRSQAQKK